MPPEIVAEPPPANSAPAGPIFGTYRPPEGTFDGCFTPEGRPRPHAVTLFERLDALGKPEFARRWRAAEKLLREHGANYAAAGEADDPRRPWRLDAIPNLVPAEAWAEIERGLEQRMRILEAVLADLYGPRTLLADRTLPASLVYRNPAFRRPWHGLPAPGGRRLQFYAADLVRDPDGKWRVLADHAEDPRGLGHALENRIVLSQTFPEAYRECGVRRLAPFFLEMRERLGRLVDLRDREPHIVVLSAGPEAGEFFEDVYLARYLGYPIVQGKDLGVRDDRVMLKTLGGLVPIDVLVRRVASGRCDPLELDGRDGQGVAGLLQSIRRRHVEVVNPPGTGLTDAPAFLAFLEPLCRKLLGEELLLPSTATWWCGGKSQLEHVRDNFADLVIRDAFGRGEPVRPGRLPAKDRDALLAKVEADPDAYVAQESLRRPSLPSSGGRGQVAVTPAYAALRTFATASAEDGVAVLPGGLTHLSPRPDTDEIAFEGDATVKDTWVASDGPVRPTTLLGDRGPLRLRRAGSELPSRVADDLFWLGRYAARAEAGAALVRCFLRRLAGGVDSGGKDDLPLLLHAVCGKLATGHAAASDPARTLASPEALYDLLRFAVSAPPSQNGRSLWANLSEMRRLAVNQRDRLSVDGWRVVAQLTDLTPPGFRLSRGLSPSLAWVNELLLDLAAFNGIVADAMTRTLGWRFLDAGRKLERVLTTSRLLRFLVIETPNRDDVPLEAILEISDCVATYRTRYFSELRLHAVVDLVVSDETNPGSIASRLAAVAEHVAHLPRDERAAGMAPIERRVASPLHDVRMFDAAALERPGRGLDPLVDLLDLLTTEVPPFAKTLADRYLHHSDVSRPLGEAHGATPAAAE